MADPQFPNFNLPQFPYQNMPQQLAASMQQPMPQTYGRFQMPQMPHPQWPSLYGSQGAPQGGGQLPQLPSGGGLPQLPSGGNVPGMGGQPPGQGMPPGMDQANWGQAPHAPMGGPTQQYNLANSVASQSQSPTGQKFLANLGKYGQAGVNSFMSNPQSASVADFNRMAQTNPVMAEQLSAAGGQGFRNAIASNNQWNPQQMNSFINQYGSGALPGFGG